MNTMEKLRKEIDLRSRKVLIIAEAGVNHNGSIKLAKKLIDVAVNANADIVKFQTFKAENLVTKNAKKAKYQKQENLKNESQFEMLKKLEIKLEDHKKLISYCRKKKILFLSSPFDLESINLLNKLGLKIFKVPSGEITNFSFLRNIGKLKKKVILSTGMANIKEIEDALKVLIKFGTKKKDITILHTNTAYPTPMKDVNLKAMLTIRKKFKTLVGYSDHTKGIEASIAAVAMGASCIEKHFTLNRKMKGPDHKASLIGEELKKMIRKIRETEIALGFDKKIVTGSERVNQKVIRRSIYANHFIKRGDIFSSKNLICLRPDTGISAIKWKKIIGRRALKNFKKNEKIKI